jgi:hypothetical protein
VVTRPDLTAARAVAESLFDCTGTIRRDPQSTTDDTFNLATGVSGRPPNDETTIYTGPMWVRADSLIGGGKGEPQGGQEIQQPRWHARVPVSAPAIHSGDVLIVDSAADEYDVEGRVFTIMVPQGGSFAITRILQLIERTRGPHT